MGGWTVLPLFDPPFLRTGASQLPIFEGPVPVHLLGNLRKTDQPLEYLKGQKLKVCKWTSVFVRVVDAQWDNAFATFNADDVDNSYISAVDRKHYEHDFSKPMAKLVSYEHGKPLAKLIPKKSTQEEFEKQISERL